MMKAKFLLVPLLLAPALNGCSGTSDVNGFEARVKGNMRLNFDNGQLVVKASGKPDARIGANGDLRIGDEAAAVTSAQRELLKRYYAEATALRDDGIAVGKAGAALGISAARDALESLFSGGEKKRSDPDMDANNRKVQAAAQRLCDDMIGIKSTQSEIAAQLPAFAPYAVFRGEVRCDKRETAASR